MRLKRLKQLSSALWSSSLTAPSTVTAVITFTCARGRLRPITCAQGRLGPITRAQGQLRPITHARVGSDPSHVPRVDSDPLHVPGVSSDPSRAPGVGSGPSRVPRVSSDPSCVPWVDSDPSPVPGVGSDPSPWRGYSCSLLTSYGLEGPRNRRRLWAGLTFCEIKSSTTPVKAGGAPSSRPEASRSAREHRHWELKPGDAGTQATEGLSWG